MSKFQKIIIYYFSGTGNAKKIASWLSEIALRQGVSSQIFDIAKTKNNAFENIDPDSIIAIISPIHGFNYPKITLDFIRKFPKGENRIVLMNTRGGLKLGNKITLGLTGIAFMLSSFVLRKKGYKTIGQIPFDMPSNWISVHPALRKNAVDFINQKNYERVEQHFKKLYFQGKDFSARKEIVQDILISPVAFAYYFIGKYFFSKSYYASYECINCNLCIKQCPVQAIKVVADRPFWTFKCESCMKCMNICPVNAIETPHGLWLILVYATSIASTYLFNNLLSGYTQFWVTRLLIFSIILILLISMFYLLQQVMLKSKSFSKLISSASFTHYKWWGRYKNNL